MTGESDQEAKGWLAELAEGGLPQVIAGPAGKAISRLIGATADIPAAWLEQKAQAIRDESTAKSEMMKALSAKSTELGMADEKLLERGLNSMLGRAYREQENREAVAAKTVEQLNDEPAPTDSEGPSDDWLNIFEEHAAKASSDHLRETWARVLAGEIRTPGSFSLATMAFLATLDARVARAVEMTLTRVVEGDVLLVGQAEGQDFNYLATARSAGIFSSFDHDTIKRRQTDSNGILILNLNGRALVIRGNPNQPVTFQCSILSQVGVELLGVIRPSPSEAAQNILIEELKNQDAVQLIQVGSYHLDQGQIRAENLVDIWDRDAGDAETTPSHPVGSPTAP